MRLSFDWLSDFVDLSGLSPQDVADKLTMGAFEVEEIRKVGPEVEGPLVVGEIVAINPIPNADKIRLTNVKVSVEDPPLTIVCGADNIIVGQRVPVALPGARVINRHDGTELRIKQSKIRGVESNGMLCSPPELGITATEGEGILILYGAPSLGSDVKKLLHLYPDWILHVEPRSNRGDALSVRGLAREVAAFCCRPFSEPAWELPPPDKTSEAVQIYLENTEDCPFLSMRILQGLMVRPSPLWMTRRLEAIGLRPVNNVVDITNYVLHELGQPLHAYDLARLKGPVIEVRRGRKGDKLTTIDGKERALTEEMLLIADSERPIGVAGVMGGKDSEVTEETAFLALEAAAFQPARVRRGSRLLGLTSDSSLRFERGVDLAAVRYASDRAAFLMLANCGGFLGRITAAGSDEVKSVTLSLRLGQIERLAELSLNSSEVDSLLSPLGFLTEPTDPDTVAIAVPSYRQQDVTREIDLVEEVCRRFGYDRIPDSMPRNSFAPQPPEPTVKQARDALTACGLSEAWLSSLVRKEASGDGTNPPTTIEVLNPLSEDHQVLRQSLLPGLIQAVVYNQDRGRKDIWLYEVGRTYEKLGPSDQTDWVVHEELKVAGVVSGSRQLSRWPQEAEASTAADYYAAKGIVENLLFKLSVPVDSVRFGESALRPAWFHPGRTAQIECLNGDSKTILGWVGEIHPQAADAADLRQPACLFELSLDKIRANSKERRFQEIHSTPSVVRDLTIDVAKGVSHGAVQSCIYAGSGAHLKSVELVSIFKLSEDMISLSFRLYFQHPQETLTNEQVEEKLARVRESLSQEISATFRT